MFSAFALIPLAFALISSAVVESGSVEDISGTGIALSGCVSGGAMPCISDIIWNR